MLILSVGLVWRHIFFWKSLDPEQRELVFFRRQTRRRITTSTCIGIVGLAIVCERWINSAPMMLLYLAGLLLLVCWILVTAALDFWSTRAFLHEMRQRHRQERAELEAEVERLRKAAETHEGNGRTAR